MTVYLCVSLYSSIVRMFATTQIVCITTSEHLSMGHCAEPRQIHHNLEHCTDPVTFTQCVRVYSPSFHSPDDNFSISFMSSIIKKNMIYAFWSLIVPNIIYYVYKCSSIQFKRLHFASSCIMELFNQIFHLQFC